MYVGSFAAAEEIQLLLPENQPEPSSARLTGRNALMVGAAVLLVAVPLGLSRVNAARRGAEVATVPVQPIA